MQISRNNNEQSIHLKILSEAFKRKIDQQAEHFIDFNRIHLKSEHRRFSSHLFNHRIVSIDLLSLDMIHFQRKTRFQTEKKRRVNLYEKNLNSNDLNHCKNLQKHRRRDFEHRILFILDTSTIKHDHLRRVITFDHQFDVFFH
jgi:hypothetical protein